MTEALLVESFAVLEFPCIDVVDAKGEYLPVVFIVPVKEKIVIIIYH